MSPLIPQTIPTAQTVSETIRRTVIASITDFARARLNGGAADFQILDLIIPRERKIRSIVGGMETALGRTLWEPLAKSLASANGFEVIRQNLMRPTIMPANLHGTIQIVYSGRIEKNPVYTADYCHAQLKAICQPFLVNPVVGFSNASTGFGVDIWLRKDGIDYFFDTKTVQPNIGSYTRYFTQLLNWYAYYYSRYPAGIAQARIVFPYNPYQENFWTKTIGGGFPLEPTNEAWVEDEFWNFCSGIPNTFELIKTTFREVAASGELQERFDALFE